MSRRPAVGLRWKKHDDDDDECGEKFFHITKKFQQLFCITCVRALQQQCHFSSLSASSCYRTNFDSTHETTHNNFPENFHSSTHELLVDFEIFNWDFFPLLFFFLCTFSSGAQLFFRVLPVAQSRAAHKRCPSTRISSTTLALNGLAHTHARKF